MNSITKLLFFFEKKPYHKKGQKIGNKSFQKHFSCSSTYFQEDKL